MEWVCCQAAAQYTGPASKRGSIDKLLLILFLISSFFFVLINNDWVTKPVIPIVVINCVSIYF